MRLELSTLYIAHECLGFPLDDPCSIYLTAVGSL